MITREVKYMGNSRVIKMSDYKIGDVVYILSEEEVAIILAKKYNIRGNEQVTISN